MYRLFYNRPLSGDVLFLLIAPEKTPTSYLRKGNVTALYHEEELIGYNIFDLKEVMKLKSKGILFAPDDKLVDVVNALLQEEGFAPLPYTRDSGYKVAKVVRLEKHPWDENKSIVTLSLGNETLTTDTAYRNLIPGSLVVIAMDGCILADGRLFRESAVRGIPHQADICSGKDLRIDEECEKAFLPNEGEKEGDDFFLGGE
ncbi:MAG: DUF4479 domain-containing protein [Bacilli bacterium]|nr:DUF4479 domain-containing protein [Bacilli bacterium]